MGRVKLIVGRVLIGFVLVSIGFAAGREIRCVTCNAIEARADSVLKSRFAAQLADGSLEWKSVDFQEDEAMAKRYGVGVSCLVLVRWRGGKEQAYRRLDEVWAKIGDEDEFARYVGDAVREFLNGGGS